MYNTVMENAGLNSVFNLRGCYLASFKAVDQFYPTHTSLIENEISGGLIFMSGSQLECQNDMCCREGQVRSRRGDKKCQGRDLVHFW